MKAKGWQLDEVLSSLSKVGRYYLDLFKRDAIPPTEQAMFTLFKRIEAESTELLQRELRSSYPFAEGELDFDKHGSAGDAGPTWFFDSMDGAVQYMRHLPGWTVNLCLVDRGEILLSVIHDPLHEETFWATRGGGAFLNGEPIRAQDREISKVMMAATSHPPFPGRVAGLSSRVGELERKLLDAYSFTRNFGPTALQLAYVAAGRIDIFAQEGNDTFNWLPGILIAKEAGAAICDKSGAPWHWGADSIVVGTPQVVAPLFAKFS